MCNHGKEISKKRVTKTWGETTFVTPDGKEVFSGATASHEYTETVRFCVNCGDYVKNEGAAALLGHIICMQCGTAWDDCPACGGTNKIPNGSGCGEAAGGWADYCNIEHPLP